MKYNNHFITNIKEIFGERGELWLGNIETHIAKLCAQRSLIFLSVMPNLSYNFVGLVKVLETDETAVIKMALEEEYILNEMRCLQSFTHGVPKVYWYDEENHALLMEHLKPGYSLKKLVKDGQDDQATRIICQEIKNLQRNQHRNTEFKHISDLAPTLSVLEGKVDNHLLSKAKDLFQVLTNDKSNDVILHGDLHHDNILASDKGWKAIDPHGYIGDPAFEVGSIIFNPYDCLPDNKPFKRRLDIMAEELPFDPKRIKAWAFCKTMLSVAWTFEDHAKIDEGELEIAAIINSI